MLLLQRVSRLNARMLLLLMLDGRVGPVAQA
jgi:hypothetical protein